MPLFWYFHRRVSVRNQPWWQILELPPSCINRMLVLKMRLTFSGSFTGDGCLSASQLANPASKLWTNLSKIVGSVAIRIWRIALIVD